MCGLRLQGCRKFEVNTLERDSDDLRLSQSSAAAGHHRHDQRAAKATSWRNTSLALPSLAARQGALSEGYEENGRTNAEACMRGCSAS